MAKKRDDEDADLKVENTRLKRQVARLRKELEKAGVSEDEDEPAKEESPPPAPTCPKCGAADLGEIQTPSGKRVTSCRSCKKYRSKSY